MPTDAASSIPYESENVRGFLHRAEGARHGLVLTHGAGGNCNAPVLVAMASAFVAAGVSVLRCDLPFRQRRPTGPPSPATAAADRAGLQSAVEAMRGLVAGPIYLGGHSYGGRQASMLVAENHGLVEALLLLSYPLHPPGKSAQLRTAHFPQLRTPAVFVHGTNDSFGSIAEMETALALITSPVRLLPVEGAGHDLKRGRFDLDRVVNALLGE
jgi:predicted alpha/beta-hydrolase family hydrolase